VERSESVETVKKVRGFRTLPKSQKYLVVVASIVVLCIIIGFARAPYHGALKPLSPSSLSMEIVYDTGSGTQTILTTYPWSIDSDGILVSGYWTPVPFRWKYHNETMKISKNRIITYKVIR